MPLAKQLTLCYIYKRNILHACKTTTIIYSLLTRQLSMKGHLVFLTENGDYSELSARLVSGSRGNSPDKLSHFWLNTEQGR